MEISKKYVIYELNRLLGNENNQTIKKIEFPGWTQNAFDSEEEAINSLINHKMVYEDYLIIKQVYITN